ncbi:hypothetical protein ACFXI0_01770 [Kitasatospora indigofera]|uniref:hypothetical protein n=1 Tax=Kitasatospora indigofera TaxID=67307 RepID=UPI00369C50EE
MTWGVIEDAAPDPEGSSTVKENGSVTTDPHFSVEAGSCWARRVPGFPRFDRDFRVTAVHTKDGVTYVETKRLDTGGRSRGRLDDVLAHATPVEPSCPGEPSGPVGP